MIWMRGRGLTRRGRGETRFCEEGLQHVFAWGWTAVGLGRRSQTRRIISYFLPKSDWKQSGQEVCSAHCAWKDWSLYPIRGNLSVIDGPFPLERPKLTSFNRKDPAEPASYSQQRKEPFTCSTPNPALPAHKPAAQPYDLKLLPAICSSRSISMTAQNENPDPPPYLVGFKSRKVRR